MPDPVHSPGTAREVQVPSQETLDEAANRLARDIKNSAEYKEVKKALKGHTYLTNVDMKGEGGPKARIYALPKDLDKYIKDQIRTGLANGMTEDRILQLLKARLTEIAREA